MICLMVLYNFAIVMGNVLINTPNPLSSINLSDTLDQ